MWSWPLNMYKLVFLWCFIYGLPKTHVQGLRLHMRFWLNCDDLSPRAGFLKLYGGSSQFCQWFTFLKQQNKNVILGVIYATAYMINQDVSLVINRLCHKHLTLRLTSIWFGVQKWLFMFLKGVKIKPKGINVENNHPAYHLRRFGGRKSNGKFT